MPAKQDIPYIGIDIYRADATAPPLRQLILYCHTRPVNKTFIIIDKWLKIKAFENILLSEGNNLLFNYNLVNPAIIGQDTGHCEIHILLSNCALNQLEEKRNGGDLNLKIESEIIVQEIMNDKTNELPRSELRGIKSWSYQAIEKCELSTV